MIIKQDLVKKIKEYFDLNIYETKVWLVLLSKGVASAGEIAELSGVPRSRTYDVLESLEKRGFAIVRLGKPVKYISVKPTEVIEKMKSKMMVEAQDKVNSLANLKGTPEYVELEQLHNTGISPIKSTDLTGSLKGRTNVLSRAKEIIENAEKEIFICTTAEDFEDKSRVLMPVIEKMANSDKKVKIALSGHPDKVKKIGTKFNLKVRQVETSARFFMADKKELLFMITPDNADEEMGIWLNSPYFTNSLHNIVETAFK